MTPGIPELFWTFFRVSVTAFGGVLPILQRALVDRKGWMTPVEFADTLALCQSIPGPNIGNIAVVVGARFRGAPGAVAALMGVFLPASVIVVALGALYGSTGQNAIVRATLGGIAAAAAGLLVAMLAKLLVLLVRDYARAALPVAAVAFAAVGLAHVSLPLVLVVLAPVSIALAWPRGQ